MQFGKAIAFPFRGPNAWPNLGLVAVCMLIPVVGPIVVNGYQIVIEKRLIENLDADAPRFSFNRFSDYLTRGVWPFLAAMVATLAIIPVVLALVGACVLGATLLQDHPAWMVAVIVAGVCAYLGVLLALGPVMLGVMLKAGLAGSFQAGFDWKFLWDFYRKAGLLTIGTQLLFSLMIFPAALVSLCIPYLGMFALITIAAFVQTHINVQLYLTYLQRGGTPISFQPEPPDPGFPVIMAPPPMPPGA